MSREAEEWIRLLQLQPHVEGGYYRETYRSEDIVQTVPQRFNNVENNEYVYCTAIYYLLKSGGDKHSSYSRFHRIKSDEMWHYYDGTTCIIIYILNESDGKCEKKLLGRDINIGAQLQLVVPHNTWFAAELLKNDDENHFVLCGCTVAPGFNFSDFEIAKRQYLLPLFPQYEQIINRLTEETTT